MDDFYKIVGYKKLHKFWAEFFHYFIFLNLSSFAGTLGWYIKKQVDELAFIESANVKQAIIAGEILRIRFFIFS